MDACRELHLLCGIEYRGLGIRGIVSIGLHAFPLC